MTNGRTLAGGMLLLTALSGVAVLRAQPAPPQPPPPPTASTTRCS